MAEAEPCCKRLKLDISYFDDESDDDFYHSEPPINQYTANQLPLIEYTNPFDSLPNEVIQEICMMLSLRDKMSFGLVNRRLYMICSDPLLWRNVVIDDAYHKTNAPFIKSALQTCGPHVQSLSLRGELPFSKYQRMILTCKNIHTLNLYGFQISVNALEKIHSDLHHLQLLSLTYIDQIPLSSNRLFTVFAKLKRVVLVYNNFEPEKLFEKWMLNNCLPQTFIIVSAHGKEYWSKKIEYLPNITHSAYFAAYRNYGRPLDFDFYDVPEYLLEIDPNNSRLEQVYGIQRLTQLANVEETRQWLTDNMFDHYLSLFANYGGTDLLMLSYEDLRDLCGCPAEGARLYIRLHLMPLIIKTIFIALEEDTVYYAVTLTALTANHFKGCIAKRLCIAPSLITAILLQYTSGILFNVDDWIIMNTKNGQSIKIKIKDESASGLKKIILTYI